MGDLPANESLAALERFVVDNDELLQLEERIGRFNIFDALGIVRTEIRHSNFLAWLLDPNESHGQGSLFLRAVLMDLLRQSPQELRPFSPIQLDGAEMRGVEIRREWRHIDILIKCSDPPFVLAIENKVDAGPHNPFEQYQRAVSDEFPAHEHMYVYLTPEGADLEEYDQWTPYSYRDIHDTVRRVYGANAASIGDDVRTFLDHYLNLIGSRFMNDPQIDELCQTIYKNHRQAIDLIMERIGSPRAQLVGVAADVIRGDANWRYLGRTQRLVRTWPAEWEGVMPQLGTSKNLPPEQWMFLQVYLGEKRCRT